MRSGHTEAAVDLCKLAGLPPVAVICELANDDGTVMVGPQIEAFAAKHGLARISVADLIAYRQAREKLVERVADLPRQDADRRAHRLCLPHHLRPRAAFRLRPRRDRRRTRRAGAPASRRHSRRHFRRRGDSARPPAVQGGGARRACLSARRFGRRAHQSERRGRGRIRTPRGNCNGARSASAPNPARLDVSSIRLRTGNPRNTSAFPALASRSPRSRGSSC